MKKTYKTCRLGIALSLILCFASCSTSVERPHQALHITSPAELNGIYGDGAQGAWNNILWGTRTPSEARNSNESVLRLHISAVDPETLSIKTISSDGRRRTETLKGSITDGGFVAKQHPSDEFIYGFLNTGTEKVSLWKVSSKPKKILVIRDFSFMTFMGPLPFMGNSGRINATLIAE